MKRGNPPVPLVPPVSLLVSLFRFFRRLVVAAEAVRGVTEVQPGLAFGAVSAVVDVPGDDHVLGFQAKPDPRTRYSQMRSNHGKQGHPFFGWLTLKGNPYPKKEEKRAPLRNWLLEKAHVFFLHPLPTRVGQKQLSPNCVLSTRMVYPKRSGEKTSMATGVPMWQTKTQVRQLQLMQLHRCIDTRDLLENIQDNSKTPTKLTGVCRRDPFGLP